MLLPADVASLPPTTSLSYILGVHGAAVDRRKSRCARCALQSFFVPVFTRTDDGLNRTAVPS